MRGSKYLSELITDPAHILPGKINLIEANTSAGKTYFALNTLPQWAGTPEKVLYLIDTINGELRLRQNIVAISRLYYELANYGEKEGWGEPIACARGKMPVMTYAGFGAEIKNAGMENHHKGKAGRDRRAGYASAGHAAGTGFDRNTHCGYCIAAAVLCGSDRARVHQAPAGGGHCRSQGEGREIWRKAKGKTRRVRRSCRSMAARRSLGPEGSRTVACFASNISPLGKTTGLIIF